MYTLFIANKNYSSWSLRPWLLMKAADIGFEEHLVPFGPDSNWEKFRTFSPSGKVPCLLDGDIAVWDSLGITEYLAERHPQVWPQDARVRAWARCAAAEMHSSFGTLRSICTMNCGVRVQLHTVTSELRRDIERIVELWSEGIERFGGPFLAGAKFTAVDAFFAPVAFRVQTYRLELPRVAMDYALRLLNLPAMRDWYEQGLAERWREPAHEAELVSAGRIIEDLRAR